MQAAKKSIKGSLLLVLESLGNKAVGVISTLILARVLVPEDFGLVAIAVLLLGIVDVLGNTSGMNYLLRANHIDDKIINTSFSLNLLIKFFLAFIFFMSADYAANYFNDIRLINIIYVFTLLIIVKALSNPAEVWLRREHKYIKIVKLSLIAKVISVSIAIFIALFYKSYWALIIGQFISVLTITIGSYILYPFKPKFELSNIKEQWNFSGWMIPQSIFGYLRTQLDTFMVSANFSKEMLGSYHVLKYLCYLPVSNIIMPAVQPLTVELAKVKMIKSELLKQYTLTLLVTLLIAVPITTIMFFHDEFIVSILLGDKWISYSEILGILGFLIPSTVLLHHTNRILVVNGKTKILFQYEVSSFIFIYSILYFAVGFSDLFKFTTSRVLLEFFSCISYFSVITIYYFGVKNLFRILFTSLIVVSNSVLSYKFSTLFENFWSESILSNITLILIYLGTFAVMTYASCFILKNNFKEWNYIINIINKYFSIGVR